MTNFLEDTSPPLTLEEIFNRSNTNARYWLVFMVMALAAAVDFFDFFLVGFIMAKVGPEWQLTYGQMAAILLGTGIGSIAGSLVGGQMADAYGRRPILIWANLICGAINASIALIPTGSWILFALLRFLGGCALGAAASTTLAYVIERTPGRYRTLVVGLNMVAPSAGIGLAAAMASVLLDRYGWRAVAVTGALPLLVALLIFLFCGESVRWLIGKGQHADALRAAERQLGKTISRVAPSPQNPHFSRSIMSLVADRRRFWLVLLVAAGGTTGLNGVYLWGPAILTIVDGLSPANAAAMFALTSLFGIGGKTFFAAVPQYSGRRAAAVISLAIGSCSLAVAAIVPVGTFAGLPLVMLCFLAMSFFLEGGYSNIFPFLVERFPPALSARGAGLVQAGGGAAKILGPLSLTVIAGSNDIIKPEATSQSVLPAFLFLATCAGLSCIGAACLSDRRNKR